MLWVSLGLKSEILIDLLIELFDFFFFFVFKCFHSVNKVFKPAWFATLLRSNFTWCLINVGLECTILFLFLYSLLLLMLCLLLLLHQPFLLLFNKLIEVSVSSFTICLWFEWREEVIWVLDNKFFDNFSLLLRLFNLSIVYDLLKPLMDREIRVFLL